MVFDKADLLGANSLPLYAWLTQSLSNPWGVNRIVFNYEKAASSFARYRPFVACAPLHPPLTNRGCGCSSFSMRTGSHFDVIPASSLSASLRRILRLPSEVTRCPRRLALTSRLGRTQNERRSNPNMPSSQASTTTLLARLHLELFA